MLILYPSHFSKSPPGEENTFRAERNSVHPGIIILKYMKARLDLPHTSSEMFSQSCVRVEGRIENLHVTHRRGIAW